MLDGTGMGPDRPEPCGSTLPARFTIRPAHVTDFLYSAVDKEESAMEMTNEVALDGDVYCFEDAKRFAEARAWIDANGCDTAQFRSVFPDARPVSTHPYGSGTPRDI